MKFLEDDVNLVQILKLILMYTVFTWGIFKVVEIINLLRIIANK